MMSQAILEIPEQFSYQPVVENKKNLKPSDHIFLIGMGGSPLAGDLALRCTPSLPITIHRDYGLPASAAFFKRPLVIASSYSGNTEETIDAYRAARKKKLAVAAIASGGKLIEMAKRDGVPFVEIPKTGIQPRVATGFMLRGLLALLGDARGLTETGRLARSLDVKSLKPIGSKIAKSLVGFVPVIYASNRNATLAYNWKIKLNETGKIPAFENVLPELNHNEMNGFDVMPSIEPLCSPFHFVLLTDKKDHPRIQKRFVILEQLLTVRGLSVTKVPIEGKTPSEQIFRTLVLADWTAIALADHYGLESEQVPMVEQFKKMLK